MMSSNSDYLYVSEVFIDQNRNVIFGETQPYETHCTTPGELFKEMQSEYGRCVSRVYRDKKDRTVAVGWVFEKRMLYEGWSRVDSWGDRKAKPDEDDYYIREVWVTVHTAPPTRTVEYHVLEMEAA